MWATIISWLSSGIIRYFLIAGIASAASVIATSHIDALAYGHTIDGLKLQASNKTATDNAASLEKLNTFIKQMQNSAENYQSDINGINNQFAKLEKEFASEKIIPLPSDCKPDNVRVRELANAITTANSSN